MTEKFVSSVAVFNYSDLEVLCSVFLFSSSVKWRFDDSESLRNRNAPSSLAAGGLSSITLQRSPRQTNDDIVFTARDCSTLTSFKSLQVDCDTALHCRGWKL